MLPHRIGDQLFLLAAQFYRYLQQFSTSISMLGDNLTTVLGLANCMIGGTILVLPLLGMTAGVVNSILVNCLIGGVSLYTAYLMVSHLGRERNITECLLAHFKHDYRYVRGYSLLIWINLIFTFIIYFRLICLQVSGLANITSPFIGVVVAIVLFCLIALVQKFGKGEETLAYGMLTILTYLVFLVWAHFTAPDGEREVPTWGKPYQLASTLQMAYSIQDFFIQNLVANPNRKDYQKMTIQTFLVGGLAYTFITFGSFAIINRASFKRNPETIEDYFSSQGWQVVGIEILYLLHLLSVFPQYVLVSRLRFSQIFSRQTLRTDTERYCYTTCILVISLLVYITGVYVEQMMSIYGAIGGYLIVIAIPLWLHFKCLHYDRSGGVIKSEDDRNLIIMGNECQCELTYRSRITLYGQSVILILIIIGELILVIYTLIGIFTQKNS